MKSIKEIYQALIDGEKLTDDRNNAEYYINLDDDGRLVDCNGKPVNHVFEFVTMWRIYKKPEPVIEVTPTMVREAFSAAYVNGAKGIAIESLTIKELFGEGV